jgi:hypothetical protein
LAIIRSGQCICQFGEKMNRRSYGCHLKVCFSLSNEEMIELVGFILFLPSRSHKRHFILVFIEVVCNVSSIQLMRVVRGTIELTVKAVSQDSQRMVQMKNKGTLNVFQDNQTLTLWK